MATQPKFQTPPVGLGSYLQGILPEDLAVSAGAFSMAMQQIRNIHNVNFEKFSQVAASIEVVTTNLNLTNGTDVPVDLPKTAENTTMLALGSGPHGTYTMSDCFGCMSGLPYSWRELQSTLLQAQTAKLTNIYQELFLAVTWDPATVSVIVETREVLISAGPPPTYQTEYRCAGFSISTKGGGYGRGTAPNPIITASNGGSGLGIVGRGPADSESLGGKTYGRITGATLTSPGSWQTSPPTATIEHPPTATLPVQSNGAKATYGTNTATGTVGWSEPMNAVVQLYIDQANAEINFIKLSKSETVRRLNSIWEYNGKQLEIEQRARYQALDPVPIPRNRWMSQFPMTISTFVDGMHEYAQSTRPHMYAQTIEAISNLKTVCGQSAVALMRQERNDARLAKLGIPLENIVPGTIETELTPVLISNGTVPAGKSGVGIVINGINGNSASPTTTYTVPATMVQQLNDPPNAGKPAGQAKASTKLAPKPMGFYDPNKNTYILVPKTTSLDQAKPIQNILNVEKLSPNKNINLLGPSKNGTGPAIPKASSTIVDQSMIQSGGSTTSLNPTPGIGVTSGITPTRATINGVGIGVAGAVINSEDGISAGPGSATPVSYGINVVETEPIAVVVSGSAEPAGDGYPLDTGKSTYPGSLAGSNETEILPPELNAAYTSAVLLPTSLTVEEAIDEVIKCNCDCWVD